jgi:phospholipid transport system substrate-binding protein
MLMVITYADRFQTYSGEKLVVVKSETRGKSDILVHTFLERPNDQEPIAVIWRLRARKNSYKIIDVMVEGLSMGITQQKEFSSVIRKNGNKVEGLLSELRKRINVDS